MRRPGFASGVIAAAALGVLATVLGTGLLALVAPGTVLRMTIALVALAYVIYLLAESASRSGRVTTLAAWVVMAVSCWMLALPLPIYVLVHALAAWLVRVLNFYRSALTALADLGLVAVGFAAAIWAYSRTGSVFLATWTLFLTQAAFIVIPPMIGRGNKPGAEDRFEVARRQADAALRTIASR